MGGKPLGLGWSLFGYRRSAVVRLVEDRDRQLSEAYARVRAAEVRVGELEGEMATMREQNARLEQHLELLRGQMVAIASRTQPLSHYLSSGPSVEEPEEESIPAAPSASQTMVTELARVLSAAEEGAARIIHQAAVAAQDQMDRTTRAWRELKAEAAKVDEWRQSMGPAITTVRSKLGDVKARIDEIPVRIQAALTPLADAMSSIQDGLAQLSSLFVALSSPEWGPGEPLEESEPATEPAEPSPNGKVEPGVIRVPEAAVVSDHERDPQDSSAWMRATVGY
jgi:chromosome segregation ATPase